MSYEKWSFRYNLLKQYVRFVDWVIHQRILIQGKENIPGNKPLVFAPNHQNALSDPMAVLLNVKHQLVWLARADIFGKSKMVDGILRFMKIMPVYRMRDGMDSLGKNETTFNTSIRVLQNNAALALFPEAAHTFKRQIKTHKKAIPRIVFMAEERTGGELDIHIIPTGIHYSHYWKFNRTLIINFGTPIRVKPFYEDYLNDQQGAIRRLREALQEATLPLIVNFKSEKHYNDFERIRKIYGERFLQRSGLPFSRLNLFNSDRQLANRLDQLEEEKPQETEQFVETARTYGQLLKKHRLKSRLLLNDFNYLPRLLGQALLLTAGFPIFLFGLLFNGLPFFSIDWFVRTKIKDRAFWSSVILVLALILFPLFYLLELWAVAPWIPGWWRLVFVASLPFAGKLAFNWYILWRKAMGTLRVLRIKWFRKDLWKTLLQHKQELFKQLDELLPCA